MSRRISAKKGKKQKRNSRTTMLVFDPSQRVPDEVLEAILHEWLIPSLVEQFVREGDLTTQRTNDCPQKSKAGKKPALRPR